MSVEFQPRFGHAAEEFERYRPDYPRELFDHILAAVPSDPRQRAVDLGAGTGKSTRALLPYFREVIAIEPDPGMAAKLKEETPQVIVHGVTAEDFSQPDSTVDLVTVGNALHWMDLQRVFANAHSWLRPGGVFAVYDHPLPKTIPAVDAIVLSELRGPWKPYRDQRLKYDKDWEAKIRSAYGFQIVESTKLSYIIPMTPSSFTGFWRSTSYGSAYALTLPNAESYWRDLESRLAAAAGGGAISVDLSPPLVIARKI